MHTGTYRIIVHAGVDPEVPLDAQSEHTLLWEALSDLDTLAWRTGRLVTGVFDAAKPGGPVDFVVVRGPPAYGWRSVCCNSEARCAQRLPRRDLFLLPAVEPPVAGRDISNRANLKRGGYDPLE